VAPGGLHGGSPLLQLSALSRCRRLDAVADPHRPQTAEALAQVHDTATRRQPRPKRRRDEACAQHAMGDALSEPRLRRIVGVLVQRIGVAGYLRKPRDVFDAYSPLEFGAIANLHAR